MKDLIKEIVANSAEKYGTTLQGLAGGEPEEKENNEKKDGDE